MIKLINTILSIFDKLIPPSEKRRAGKLIEEDIKLQKAIQRGDVMEIERIRQRKQKYKALISLGIVLLISGCRTPYSAIPVMGDNIPVKLQLGSPITLLDGSLDSVKEHKNTLVSDAYIFESVTSQDNVKKN